MARQAVCTPQAGRHVTRLLSGAGESVTEPLRYYHNITANVVNVLEAMRDSSVEQVGRPHSSLHSE